MKQDRIVEAIEKQTAWLQSDTPDYKLEELKRIRATVHTGVTFLVIITGTLMMVVIFLFFTSTLGATPLLSDGDERITSVEVSQKRGGAR